jgi:hypothetical protein
MTTYSLKTLLIEFEPVWNGLKFYEIRDNDYDYCIGDTLILCEWDPKTEFYTGREIVAIVSHMTTTHNYWGLPSSICVMSFIIKNRFLKNKTFEIEKKETMKRTSVVDFKELAEIISNLALDEKLKKINLERSEVYEQILKEAKNGKNSLSKNSLSEEVKDELLSAGFDVKSQSDITEDGCHISSWMIRFPYVIQRI